MKNMNEPILNRVQTSGLPENEIDTTCYSSTGTCKQEDFVNAMFSEGGLPKFTNLEKKNLQNNKEAVHPFNSSM